MTCKHENKIQIPNDEILKEANGIKCIGHDETFVIIFYSRYMKTQIELTKGEVEFLLPLLQEFLKENNV
jgi:hypothetical protein